MNEDEGGGELFLQYTATFPVVASSQETVQTFLGKFSAANCRLSAGANRLQHVLSLYQAQDPYFGACVFRSLQKLKRIMQAESRAP